jgi:flagellar biosynthesis protein FliR
MPAEPLVSTAAVLGFLLTLARIAGAFVFVPVPGLKNTFELPRIMLALAVTLSLYPQWPRIAPETSPALLVLWVMAEAALGIGIGLAVGFASEALALGGQIMGLQAGYAYASTVDPSTQADSGILVVFSQLAAGLLFFALGLDREVLRIFARSLETCPPGTFTLTRPAAEHILALGSTMFSTGLRLALPMVALLIMVDISLALLGRVNSQLQLLTVAFPIKMMVGLTLLGWLTLLFPVLFRAVSRQALSAAGSLVSR